MAFIHDLERSGKWILATIIMFFTLHNGGAIEGMIFPVADVFYINTAEDKDNDGWAELSGTFKKTRECDYHDIEWFWQGETNSTRIPLKYPSAKIRSKGSYEFSNWLLYMPYDQIKDQSYAIVYHECHPFWKTKTKFYP